MHSCLFMNRVLSSQEGRLPQRGAKVGVRDLPCRLCLVEDPCVAGNISSVVQLLPRLCNALRLISSPEKAKQKKPKACMRAECLSELKTSRNGWEVAWTRGLSVLGTHGLTRKCSLPSAVSSSYGT